MPVTRAPQCFGEVKRKAAPAAADVEHALAGRCQELGREMALLGELGIVERLIGRFEIGAAILPVDVEKQRVEPAIEIIMVRDIASRLPSRVELRYSAMEVADQPLRPSPTGSARLARYDGEHIGDRALLDDDAAIHVGFTEPELGIEQDTALGRSRDEADRDRRADPVTDR